MSAFTPAGSGGAPSSPVIIGGATSQVITVLSMDLAGTEYPVVLPVGTKKYRLRLLDGKDLNVAYQPSGSAQQIPRYCFLAEGGLSLTTTMTLYLSSDAASQRAELVVWI